MSEKSTSPGVAPESGAALEAESHGRQFVTPRQALGLAALAAGFIGVKCEEDPDQAPWVTRAAVEIAGHCGPVVASILSSLSPAEDSRDLAASLADRPREDLEIPEWFWRFTEARVVSIRQFHNAWKELEATVYLIAVADGRIEAFVPRGGAKAATISVIDEYEFVLIQGEEPWEQYSEVAVSPEVGARSLFLIDTQWSWLSNSEPTAETLSNAAVLSWIARLLPEPQWATYWNGDETKAGVEYRDPDDVAWQFTTSQEGRVLDVDSELVDEIAWTSEHEADVLNWSPRRARRFLRYPADELTDAQLRQRPALLRAFVRFADRTSGRDPKLTLKTLEAIDVEEFDELAHMLPKAA